MEGEPMIMIARSYPNLARLVRVQTFMKPTIILLALLSTPVFADGLPERWRASVMRLQHGYGAAFAYAPSAAWDVEAAVSERSYEQPVSTFSVGTNPAIPITEVRHYTA